MKISTALILIVLVFFATTGSFAWGMVYQFSKLSVPVMGAING